MARRDDNAYSYFQSHAQRVRSASSDPNHERNDQRKNTISRTARTVEEDRHNEKVVHGMKLLLAARDRVLTLSEQRVCFSFRCPQTWLIPCTVVDSRHSRPCCLPDGRVSRFGSPSCPQSTDNASPHRVHFQ